MKKEKIIKLFITLLTSVVIVFSILFYQNSIHENELEKFSYKKYLHEFGFSKTENPTEEEIQNSDKYFNLLDKATYEKNKENYTEAENIYMEAVKYNIIGYQEIGRMYLEDIENTGKAIEYFEKAYDKGDINAAFWLGQSYEKINDENMKRKWYEKGALNGDTDSEIYFGRLLYLENKKDEAEKWFRKVLINSKNAIAIYNLMMINYEKGNIKEVKKLQKQLHEKGVEEMDDDMLEKVKYMTGNKKQQHIFVYLNNADNFIEKKQYLEAEKEYIKEVYEDLAYYYQIGVASGAGYSFVFEIDKFCRTFKHFPVQTHSALQILERAGYIHYEMDPEARARVMFKLGRNDLYRLDEGSAFEEAVITALLRNYGGLFSNYVYIDEGLLAQEAELTTHQVYVILKNLAQRNIINFIPQRKTPFITYLRDRVDGERVVLSKEIYEERKAQYVARINAMQAYATNGDVCRSRQLLIYFGEERHKDCQQCDVCLEHASSEPSNEQTTTARNAILNLLKDGERHHITELHKLNLPQKGLDVALEYLIYEEEVRLDGSFLYFLE